MKKLNSEIEKNSVSEIERADTQARTQKPISYEKMVDLYYQAVYYYSVGLLNQGGCSNGLIDAKDIVQNVFLNAFVYYDTFRPDGSCKAWLYAIARQQVMRYFIKKRTRGRHTVSVNEDLYFEIASEGMSPEKKTFLSEKIKIVSDGISLLPPKQKAAFLLRHVHGLGFEEIAQELNCSPHAALQNVYYASHNLRKSITD